MLLLNLFWCSVGNQSPSAPPSNVFILCMCVYICVCLYPHRICIHIHMQYVTCGEKSANSPESRHVFALLCTLSSLGIPKIPLPTSDILGTPITHLINKTQVTWLKTQIYSWEEIQRWDTSTKQLYLSLFFLCLPSKHQLSGDKMRPEQGPWMFLLKLVLQRPSASFKQNSSGPRRTRTPCPPGITTTNTNHRMDCNYND